MGSPEINAASNDVIIGVDIGGSTVSVGRVEQGEIVETYAASIQADQAEGIVLENVFKAIEQVQSPEVKGIGCGVPGLVDAEQGIVHNLANIPSWKRVHLKEHLETRFKLPAYINNDANCFAAGVKHFGEGRSYQNLVGITLGTGFGTGLILNNRLYSGRNGGAGEYGSLDHGDKDIEAYCSGQFFTNEFGITAKECHERAMQGDAQALDMFKAYGTELGKAIKVIMYTLDPEIIILGGSVSTAYNFFISSLREEVNNFEFKRSLEGLKITQNTIPDIALLGAAALYQDSLA